VLKLESHAAPRPENTIEVIGSGESSGAELFSYYVDRTLAVAGVALKDIPFPDGTAVSVIERAGELMAPSGDMMLEPGDHVFVLARREDRPFIGLLFGREEEH
jgi:cell volume regulation protein A